MSSDPKGPKWRKVKAMHYRRDDGIEALADGNDFRTWILYGPDGERWGAHHEYPTLRAAKEATEGREAQSE